MKRLWCWFCGCNNDNDEFVVVKDSLCQWQDCCDSCSREGAEKVSSDGTIWMREGFRAR